MRPITHALFAVLLAVVAATASGCGDDTADCPSNVGNGVACSTTLTCLQGSQTCACKGGQWDCNTPVVIDMHIFDLSGRDMTSPPTD